MQPALPDVRDQPRQPIFSRLEASAFPHTGSLRAARADLPDLVESVPVRVSSPELLWPPDGAVVTDPLAIRGRFSGSVPPDLYLDRQFAMPLRGAAAWDTEEFVAVLDVPYLTEGAHLLSLRQGDGRDHSLRTVHVWKPPPQEPSSIQATSSVAVGRTCRRSVSRAGILVDGRPWKRSRWLCAPSPGGWRGIAWLDLEGAGSGPHRVTIKPLGQSAADYTVVRL